MTITTNPLDALLAIRDGYISARWNYPDAVGTPVSSPGGIGNAAEVTFSFLTAVPPYFSTTGFVQFSALQKQAAREVLASIANVVRVTFTEVSGIGDMTFAMNAQSGSAGYAYYPTHGYSYDGSGIITSAYAMDVAGDVWLNSNVAWTPDDFAPGGAGYGTLVHEAGHALGLKHPFSGGYVLDASLDSTQYTVMSYTEHPYGFFRTVSETSPGSYTWQYEYIQPETFMPLDIAALQYLYGANTSYHSGNDTYTFETSRPFIKTIWDGGGKDTISVANFSLGCVIDLRAGYFSSISIPSDPLPSGYTETNSGIYDGTDNLAIASGAIIENATGGAGNDHLTGNGVANVLDGGAGIDTMIGGDGSDLYYVRNSGDIVTETNATVGTGGTDKVYSYLNAYTLGANVENGRILATGAANLTGNSLNNLLYAGVGNNVLNGGTGTDTVSYSYASSAVTVSLAVISAAQATGGSGTDTLTAIENLTGSNYNDMLTGNTSANILSGGLGNDTLNGGTGADTMTGGDGADIYYVDNNLDIVTETNATAGAGGTDKVYSYLNAYALGANVENGRIRVTGAADLTGNSLNNLLYAGAGNNVINGGTGTDTVSYSYAGRDVTANLAVATAQATGGSGTDTLTAIENLTGSNYNDKLYGNSAANTLSGGQGDDILYGRAGSDILTGGAGLDIFRFNATLNAATNLDNITDFSALDDTIQLENAVFAAIGTLGSFVAVDARFYAAAGAVAGHDATDRIIYNTTSGALYYDADGSGTGSAIQFALLTTHPTIASVDFIVV